MKIRQAEFSGLEVNIATVGRGVRFTIQPKQAGGSVTALAPVANACRSCVVAVNGDFFSESTHEPIGGVISNGVVLRSPNPRQNQLTIAPDGRISAGMMQWHGEIAASDGTTMPVAINDPAADSPVLYDGRFGSPTPRRAAVEIAFAAAPVDRPAARSSVAVPGVGSHRPGQRGAGGPSRAERLGSVRRSTR